MWVHLIAIAGLAVLCAAWVGLELWLRHLDPAGGARGEHCGGCGCCATGQEISQGPNNVPDTGDGMIQRGA